ncbi:MAG: GTPase Era, partial [Candidatus Cardinium sp.]|nr:GTPase Era [Candidatus Cardinium sp.]
MNNYKAGFVAIIGKPNAGKSTLMNLLIREELAITHAKAQTTRHTLYGIASGAHFQIIYTDTPGIITPAYPLQTAMMEAVNTAYAGADIMLWVVDARELESNPLPYESNSNKPALLVLNKIDLLTPTQLDEAKAYWIRHHPAVEIISISASQNKNIDQLTQKVVEWLPYHPPYYPEDFLTDRPERFFAQEIIRKKILDYY